MHKLKIDDDDEKKHKRKQTTRKIMALIALFKRKRNTGYFVSFQILVNLSRSCQSFRKSVFFLLFLSPSI